MPIVVTLWFRWVALRVDETKQKLIWERTCPPGTGLTKPTVLFVYGSHLMTI